jgi:hypothetical protein
MAVGPSYIARGTSIVRDMMHARAGFDQSLHSISVTILSGEE